MLRFLRKVPSNECGINRIMRNMVGIPKRDELDAGLKKYYEHNEMSKCKDCEYMMNLVNETLQKSIKETRYKYTFTKIDLSKLKDFDNINIKKCEGFEEYEKRLNEEGIKIKIQKTSSEIMQVDYDRERRVVTIESRWL